MGLFRSATIARARLPASDFFRRAPLIQQFAEFLHLASTAISGKAIPVGVPLFEVARTNPMAIAAVHADVDHAPAWTIVTAAFVSHDSPGRVKPARHGGQAAGRPRPPEKKRYIFPGQQTRGRWRSRDICWNTRAEPHKSWCQS